MNNKDMPFSLTFLWRRPKIAKVCLPLARFVSRLLPLYDNRVMLMSRNGYYWSCNPKVLALELAKTGEWDVNVGVQEDLWKSGKCGKQSGITFLYIGTFSYYYRLFTARYFITNETVGQSDSYPFKRKGQIFLYTTHGGAGIKRSTNAGTGKVLAHWSYNDSQQDYILSNSHWSDLISREQFCFRQPILHTGFPRNDIFFQSKESLRVNRENVLCSLHITDSEDLRILLYAPTFRFRDTAKCAYYEIDLKRVLAAFHSRFGGHWVAVVHKHPYTDMRYHRLHDFGDPDIIDGLQVPDIQNLLVVSDAMVTDYSSAEVDFALTGRPQFQFFVDGAQWPTLCMMDPKELPFPYAENNDQLCAAIENFDEKDYARKLAIFLRETIRSREDGHSSERVIQWLKEHKTNQSNS